MIKHLFIFSSVLLMIGACGNGENVIDKASNSVEDGVNETREFVEEDTRIIVNNIQEKINEVETSVDEQFIVEGENVKLNSTAFIAYDEDAYEELYDLFQINTYDGDDYQALMESNDIRLLEEGTELYVLDTDLTEIKVLNPETEETGFIHSSLLKQTSS